MTKHEEEREVGNNSKTKARAAEKGLRLKIEEYVTDHLFIKMYFSQ